MKGFDAATYAEAAASALDLPLPDDCRPGVIASLLRLAAMADQLLAFPLARERDDEASPPA